MMKIIRPMMEKLQHPKTPRDESFALMYGKELKEAYKYCLRYEKIFLSGTWRSFPDLNWGTK